MMPIKNGDKVKVEYEGKLENGEIFDSTQHGDHSHPLEFEVGAGQIIPGFDKAVLGMEDGEEKQITLQPKDAYGSLNPDLIKKIPRDQLPKEELKAGMMLALSIPNGAQIPAIYFFAVFVFFVERAIQIRNEGIIAIARLSAIS